VNCYVFRELRIFRCSIKNRW